MDASSTALADHLTELKMENKDGSKKSDKLTQLLVPLFMYKICWFIERWLYNAWLQANIEWHRSWPVLSLHSFNIGYSRYYSNGSFCACMHACTLQVQTQTGVMFGRGSVPHDCRWWWWCCTMASRTYRLQSEGLRVRGINVKQQCLYQWHFLCSSHDSETMGRPPTSSQQRVWRSPPMCQARFLQTSANMSFTSLRIPSPPSHPGRIGLAINTDSISLVQSLGPCNAWAC